MITNALRERYKNDPKFYCVVNLLNNSVVRNEFTIKDFQDALKVVEELVNDRALRSTWLGDPKVNVPW